MDAWVAAGALPTSTRDWGVEVAESRKQTGEIAHPVDAHVGRRIRTARVSAGITQIAAGEALGLSFQQIQKYESGYNRISASRLYELARLTAKPIQWFFEGAEDDYPEVHDEPLRLSEWKLLMAFRALPEDAQDSLAKLIRMLPMR